MTGLNFWDNASKTVNEGGAAFVTSSGQASVLTQETDGNLEVAVSDPTQANTGTIELEINRPAKNVSRQVSGEQ